MKRYEAVDEITKYITEKIKDFFSGKYIYNNFWNTLIESIPQDSQYKYSNDHTNMFLIKEVSTFNYKKWKEKEDFLLCEIKACNLLLELKKKKVLKIGNIETYSNWKFKWNKFELTLDIGFGEKFKEKINEIVKTKKELELENYKTALEIELDKTRQHIKWLEENINSIYEVFEKSKKNKEIKKTRKIQIKE